jgi:hypothetical protein
MFRLTVRADAMLVDPNLVDAQRDAQRPGLRAAYAGERPAGGRRAARDGRAPARPAADRLPRATRNTPTRISSIPATVAGVIDSSRRPQP